ncbi:SDR family oxidoreductase [Agromyces soli]
MSHSGTRFFWCGWDFVGVVGVEGIAPLFQHGQNRRMNGRRAVVTGASSGIGEATVRALRAGGWEVVAVARRADRLRALAEETGAAFVVCDVTRQDDVDALAAELARGGPVHGLVNNAGGAKGVASVEASDPEDWRWMFEVNVLGLQRVTAALLPLLRQGAAERGVADLVNVTSIAGHVPYAGGGGYNAAKSAAHAVTAVLRLELNGEPIRVVEVAPGMVRTEEFSLVRYGGDREKAEAVYAGVAEPLAAEDVAAVIADAMGKPRHVDLDLIVVKPVAQAAPHLLARGPLEVRTGR